MKPFSVLLPRTYVLKKMKIPPSVSLLADKSMNFRESFGRILCMITSSVWSPKKLFESPNDSSVYAHVEFVITCSEAMKSSGTSFCMFLKIFVKSSCFRLWQFIRRVFSCRKLAVFRKQRSRIMDSSFKVENGMAFLAMVEVFCWII